MNKRLIKNVLLALTLLAAGLSFYSCEKGDPEYKVVITVKYQTDSTLVVPGAKVTLSKNDILDTGVTDLAGQYSTKFKYEMILDVLAKIDTGTMGFPQYVEGTSTVRLQEDKTVYRTVLVSLKP